MRLGTDRDLATEGRSGPGRGAWALGPLVVFGVVFVAALAGIWSRSTLPLANFWPANALLLGIMVRWPGLRTSASWTAAVVGYFAADLLTGSAFEITLWLTIPNLVGPLLGVQLYDRIAVTDRRLMRPESLLLMLGVTIVVSVGAAVPGMYSGSRFFDLSVQDAFLFWTTGEVASCLGILPVVLAVPARPDRNGNLRRAEDRAPLALVDRYGPAVAVVASLVLGVVINGPGALAYCVPALLWAALRSEFFTTACLVLVATSWNLLALGFGHLDFFEYEDLESSVKVSLQSGLALMSLGPLMVAATTRARERAYRTEMDLASRDELTGALVRRAFTARADRILDEASRSGHRVAVMMIDVDLFKAVNDTHGHSTGDEVLGAVAEAVRSVLRETDAFGRIGGEEFAVVVPGVSRATAGLVAEGIRAAVAGTEVTVDGGGRLAVTVSIGVVQTGRSVTGTSLPALLAAADDQLYAAKAGGRNQVRSASRDELDPA